MRFTPEIPTWPQLPRRHFHENMYVQFTEGFPGLRLDEDRERVYVLDELPIDEVTTFFEALESDDPARFAISAGYAAAIPLLESALAGTQPPFVKGQVTGPVSLGLGLSREDRRALLYDDTLRDVAVHLIVMKARWQLGVLAAWAPESTPLIMVDEPSLTQMGSAFVSIPENLAFPALERCLRALPCLAGIHVCGGTDWSMIASFRWTCSTSTPPITSTRSWLTARPSPPFFVRGVSSPGAWCPTTIARGGRPPPSGRPSIRGAEALVASAGGSSSSQRWTGRSKSMTFWRPRSCLPPAAPAPSRRNSPNGVSRSRRKQAPGCAHACRIRSSRVTHRPRRTSPRDTPFPYTAAGATMLGSTPREEVPVKRFMVPRTAHCSEGCRTGSRARP